MDEGGEFRCWEELIPDALGLIFSKLSLQEILTVIPRVCKSWGKAVLGPYCWQDIDIEEWSQLCEPEQLDRMLRMLINRSCGSLRKLSVSGLPNDPLLSFIANHAGSLQTLRLPRSEISDSIVEQVSGRLSNITFLDISYCEKIGARALEAIGRHCKLLVWLRRMMHPVGVADKVCQDDEAHAIAISMPKLKNLEMSFLLITTEGVHEILLNCRELESLDVRGCWDVKLDDAILKKKWPSLKVLGPHIAVYYDDIWDVCSNYSDYSDWDYSYSSGYFPWELMGNGTGLYDSESFDGVWDYDQGFDELEF